MKFNLRGYTILLSVLLFCVSCGDATLFDTDKWSSQIEGWEPGIKGAVAHGEFTLGDFLQDTARDFRIEKEWMDGDSILVVKYSEENIYSINIADVFRLEKTDIKFEAAFRLPDELLQYDVPIEDRYPDGGYKLPKPNSTIEEIIPLPSEFNGTSLRQITMSDGWCTYRLPDLGDVKYEVKVSYKSNGEEVILLKADESLGGRDEKLPLKDRVFDLYDNKIELEFEVWLKEGRLTTTNFDVWVQFSDYDFSEVQGKIVKAGGIDINKDFFKIDIDILNDIDGSIRFTDPRLELVLKNKGLGVPFGVNMTFEGEDKNGLKDTLFLNQPLVFAGNSSATETEYISQQVDKSNSNIVDFLSLLPRGDIFYSGKVTLNPDGEKDNVIYRDASLDMDLNISVPVALTGNLSYSDTVSDIDIEQKFADKIVEGAILLHVQENALTLDLSVPKMILLDENNVPLDTVIVGGENEDEKKIKAGQKGMLSFYISEKIARDLGKTKNIVLEAAVSGDSGEPVKADAKVKFVLTLEVRTVIKDYDDF